MAEALGRLSEDFQPHQDDLVRDLLNQFEDDLRRINKTMAESGAQVRRVADQNIATSVALNQHMDQLRKDVQSAGQGVKSLASDIASMSEVSAQLGAEAERSETLAHKANQASDDMTQKADALTRALSDISGIVKTIAAVAGQTNLLALNATIEAARAGEAGRGFSVVAAEVKALADQTKAATQNIAKSLDQIAHLVTENNQSISSVKDILAEISASFLQLSDRARSQVGTLSQVSDASQRVVILTDSVDDCAKIAVDEAGTCLDSAEQILKSADVMDTAIAESTRKLITVLRQTPQGNRRQYDRWPIQMSVEVTLSAGEGFLAQTVDLSLGGVLLRPEFSPCHALNQQGFKVRLGSLGSFDLYCVAVSDLGVHCKFTSLDEAQTLALKQKIAELEAAYEVFVGRSKRLAAQISEVLTQDVSAGRIGLETLFDRHYRPIPGTDPIQFEVNGLSYLEDKLTPLQEAALAEDAKIAFAAFVDLNGYLPVHNKRYSLPQKANDPVWNSANSRNRRIFDDRAGFLAGRNTRPVLVQTYLRDIGGQKIMMREVDVPVHVFGRHLGGVRIAYRFD